MSEATEARIDDLIRQYYPHDPEKLAYELKRLVAQLEK